jgi:DNA-binding CsgD family transcriptional regulator
MLSQAGFDVSDALLGALAEAQDRDTLHAAFLSAAASAHAKHVGALLLSAADDGTLVLVPIIDAVPVEITTQRLSVHWPRLADVFAEFMNGRGPFEVNTAAGERHSASARAILQHVLSKIGALRCLAVPVHREGILRGGAYFLADRDFVPAEVAFLGALCELAYDRLAALSQAPPPEVNPLTARQREALSYCAQGKSDWEIAQLLDISPATAHEHIEAAKKRLGVRTRVQAAVLAVRKGWICFP